MRSHDADGSLVPSLWSTYTWSVLAALTCPCHLPILALLLSGTAAGALLTEHLLVAFTLLSILFATFLLAAVRKLQKKPDQITSAKE